MSANFIFTDTSAWYAYVDKSDAYHLVATQFARTLPAPLVTSTYILDETLTLIQVAPGANREAGAYFRARRTAGIRKNRLQNVPQELSVLIAPNIPF